MTQEEKAEAYDEALERAKSLLSGNQLGNAWIYKLLPELSESKDEKIRKGLIRAFKSFSSIKIWNGIECTDILAWLEKQSNSQLPTFTFDDVLALQCCMETVKKVQEDKELYSQLQSLHARIHDAYWLKKQGEQKDILEGAVLDSNKDGLIADTIRYKTEKQSVECSEDNLPEFESYLCLMFQKFRIKYSTKGICTNGEIIDYVMEHSQKLKDTLCHAWSEKDYDMLYKATAVINKLCAEGKDYVWSVNTLNELFYWFKSLKDRVKPNSNWSEEDELNLSEALHHIRMYNLADKADKLDKWLKSLKTRVQPQQKWSDEDERQYRAAIAICNSLGHTSTANWLKSHRPQPTWKPNKAQMKDLAFVADQNKDNMVGKTMISLYKDLIKLTE